MRTKREKIRSAAAAAAKEKSDSRHTAARDRRSARPYQGSRKQLRSDLWGWGGATGDLTRNSCARVFPSSLTPLRCLLPLLPVSSVRPPSPSSKTQTMSTPSTPAVPAIDAEGATSKAATSFKKVRVCERARERKEETTRARVRGAGGGISPGLCRGRLTPSAHAMRHALCSAGDGLCSVRVGGANCAEVEGGVGPERRDEPLSLSSAGPPLLCLSLLIPLPACTNAGTPLGCAPPAPSQSTRPLSSCTLTISPPPSPTLHSLIPPIDG